MRIIAGKAKGHVLRVPKGLPVRPTTELVRGAIFSILESLTDNWDQVLDLYAGSGALGIEALSRGAGWADFVEQDPRLCAAIKENLEKTGFSAQGRVHCTKVRKALTFLNKQYNMVFMDPPYAEAAVAGLLAQLAPSPLLAAGSIVVALHSSRSPSGPTYDGLSLIKERRHGDTSVSVYQKEMAEP